MTITLALIDNAQAGDVYLGNGCGIVHTGALDHHAHLGVTRMLQLLCWAIILPQVTWRDIIQESFRDGPTVSLKQIQRCC